LQSEHFRNRSTNCMVSFPIVRDKDERGPAIVWFGRILRSSLVLQWYRAREKHLAQ
jgi:hypothetical protein